MRRVIVVVIVSVGKRLAIGREGKRERLPLLLLGEDGVERLATEGGRKGWVVVVAVRKRLWREKTN